MKFFTTLSLIWAFALASTAQAQTNPWAARHRLTSAQYQSTFNSFVSQGYRLNYVSGYTLGTSPRYAAIWEKKVSPAWSARHGLTSAQYQNTFNALGGQGYRLVLVNGYTVNGEDRYAAIWDKSPAPGPWVARHGLTSAQYQAEFNRLVAQGYRPKHVSGYAVGNQARYAAIWVKTGGPAWVARHGLTSAQYQSEFDRLAALGYRLVVVSGYGVGGVDYYAAIWERKTGGPWVARHRMDSATYQSEFNKYVSQGYMLKVVSGYTVAGGQDRYAALWEK